MRQSRDKPRLSTRTSGELVLSGKEMADLARAVVEKGIPFRLKTKGDSMAPFLRDGDKVTIYPKRRSIRVGEIAACIDPVSGRLVLHRIVRRHAEGYILKGDNVPFSDGFIAESDILGLIGKKERKGRKTRWGLGPERRILAWLSRRNWLIRLRLRTFPSLPAPEEKKEK